MAAFVIATQHLAQLFYSQIIATDVSLDNAAPLRQRL
jgi:hypothetical protein